MLLDGSLNARPRPRPAQLKKTTSKIAWMMAPASALTPTAVTPADGSTPHFCR